MGQCAFPLWAPALLIAMGLIMPFLLITYYVRPFQSATGTLSADGSLDWFAGETMVAIGWNVLYIRAATFAIKVIRDKYSPSRQVKAPDPI